MVNRKGSCPFVEKEQPDGNRKDNHEGSAENHEKLPDIFFPFHRLSLHLHFGSHAVTERFHLCAVRIGHDIVDIGFHGILRFTLRVHMLIAPDVPFSAVGIFQSRCNPVDRHRIYRTVADQIRKGNIADGTFRACHRLKQGS